MWTKKQKANYMKDYRSKNPNNRKEAESILKLAKRQYASDYLRSHPCVDCGEQDIVVLEFDHVRGEKKKNISNLIMQSYGFNTLVEEIKKCDIRCANCHRRATHNRGKWNK